MPTVSVVIPTYNRAELLTRAIDSVLAQTYDDFELVVVDDGSTDDTEAVVTGYDDDRVRYLAHETNRGANPARNTGIEAAEGEYVAFLDSDDEWRPRKLDAQLDRLSGTGDEWVAVYCDYEVTVPGASGLIREAAADLLATDDGEAVVEGGEDLVGPTLADTLHTGAGSTLLVRTEVARRIDGFDEDLDWFQDPDFLLRVLLEGNLAHVPEPLVVRHYSGSPDADTAAAADEEFLDKHADSVRRAERDGYDVRGAHDLVLAKYYLREGRFLRGLAKLRTASAGPRQVPSLAWFAATGSRRGRSAMLAALAMAVLVARRSR
ncbi:glycosyltransferase (plasmid) [Halorussus limi]|uniref:Glycosyltransferase n=1 Tax=Halorussus limi TaxID=2938695 RepID=A0A8U0I0C1_9EURY|nr:glycosyltransferase family A protein [Halorussus limi]UPV76852.1 glycosyltransferase [Halorussus limi]